MGFLGFLLLGLVAGAIGGSLIVLVIYGLIVGRRARA